MTPDPEFSFVRQVSHVEAIDSTNDLARRLLVEGPLELPMLIWADRQTRGRGQGANAWWSDGGSLTATVILDPSEYGLSIAQESMVALTVASVVVLAIRTRYPGCEPGIRWPNDVDLGGLKLGGILPERVESPAGPRLLIGIGLNVLTRLEDAPPEVRRIAATLSGWKSYSKQPIRDLLECILARLPSALSTLARGGSELPRSWNQFDTLAGSRILLNVDSEFIHAFADGIDDSGGLRIIQNGQSRIIHAGRILRD
jgi:BirA family transcriptional regulator, biotin operon repressor / biotin---[acetyl-CoA-carboxylase] ligase